MVHNRASQNGYIDIPETVTNGLIEGGYRRYNNGSVIDPAMDMYPPLPSGPLHPMFTSVDLNKPFRAIQHVRGFRHKDVLAALNTRKKYSPVKRPRRHWRTRKRLARLYWAKDRERKKDTEQFKWYNWTYWAGRREEIVLLTYEQYWAIRNYSPITLPPGLLRRHNPELPWTLENTYVAPTIRHAHIVVAEAAALYQQYLDDVFNDT